MTHIRLIKTLAAELRQLLSVVKMPIEYATAAQDFIVVNVFEQLLPKDLFDETTYYPLVLVEWLTTEEDLSGPTTAQVGITIGVYGKEADGWVDAFYIMEKVRQHLLKKRLIGRRFRLKDEITWQVPSQQPAPFFFIMGNLSYEVFQTQEELTI